jgi:hypothetical protein
VVANKVPKGAKTTLLATRIRRKYPVLSAGYELLSKLQNLYAPVRSNMLCADERVVKNAAGTRTDGLKVSEFKPWLVAHWSKVKQALLAGECMPAAVRKVEIPKPQGGVHAFRAHVRRKLCSLLRSSV